MAITGSITSVDPSFRSRDPLPPSLGSILPHTQNTSKLTKFNHLFNKFSVRAYYVPGV